MYLWPFLRSGMGKDNYEFYELTVHQEAITTIRVSYDDEYLITGSADGSIYFLRLRELVDGEDVTSIDALTNYGTGKEKNGGVAAGKLTGMYGLNDFCFLSS